MRILSSVPSLKIGNNKSKQNIGYVVFVCIVLLSLLQWTAPYSQGIDLLWKTVFHYDSSDYQQLINRRNEFINYTGTKKQVFLTLITNHGVTDNRYSQELVDVEVLLEDIVGSM